MWAVYTSKRDVGRRDGFTLKLVQLQKVLLLPLSSQTF